MNFDENIYHFDEILSNLSDSKLDHSPHLNMQALVAWH